MQEESCRPMDLEVQPNGPGCPPVCQVASAVVTLRRPAIVFTSGVTFGSLAR